MPRTRKELERLAADTEAVLDRLNPAVLTNADRLEDLGVIRGYVDEIIAAEDRLTSAVVAARRNGRSWGDLALVLGVSRQAAEAKYAEVAADG
jgi:hypothetical protein